MLSFPTSTVFERRIPKQKFYQNLDVTAEVKSGANIVFKNKTAVNGAAFNFRITVERGTSAGGYISGVSGAFQ